MPPPESALAATGFPAAESAECRYQRRRTSEGQCAHVLDVRKLFDLFDDFGRYRAVDFDQRDGIAAGRLPAEVKGRDVDAGVPQNAGEMPDEARLVHIGDVEHRGPELGIHLDTLDGDDARPAVGEYRALDRALLTLGDDRQGDQAVVIALRVA